MAKKKEISKEIAELKKELVGGKLLLGRKEVQKGLQRGELVKIYLAVNCPGDVRGEIERYAEMVKVPVVDLEVDNEEIGVLCKKHFFISVLGVKK